MLLNILRNKKVMGPVCVFATVVVVGILDTFKLHGLDYSVAPAWTIIVFTFVLGGSFPGVLSAGIVMAYSIYSGPTVTRIYIIIASLGLLSIGLILLEMGVLTSTSADKLLDRLTTIDALSLANMINWANRDEAERYNAAENLHSELGSMFTYVYGWHALAKEFDELKAEQEKIKRSRG